ncbi:MAG: 4-(cytidine 5'-diphospho)-2-C-methyl-D-erythritol kinase [Candidatus Hydrogenedentes bacterium]|nr:4-(cytidine 5'-diphospho)-2-C-methyl-D-erythritol kinase [Candidatus Hydrogenedentota bacterium]
MADCTTWLSYAKINLYLEVLNRRRDGFHNIETLFQSVGLADRLTFQPRPAGLSMTCSTDALECGPGNLVHRAATLLQQYTGCTQGVHVHLDKRIPIAAGLAGGSGNAAATLAALNALWGLGLPAARLRALGLALGSDVPYCIEGGTVAATGRGERLHRLEPLPETWFVLVHPPIAVTAREVYTSPVLERSGERPFAGRTASFRRALRALRAGDWPRLVFNRMERPVFALHPELAAIPQRLVDAGCCAAAMSGSGPTCFGVCTSRAGADRAAGAVGEYPASVVASVDSGVERAD